MLDGAKDAKQIHTGRASVTRTGVLRHLPPVLLAMVALAVGGFEALFPSEPSESPSPATPQERHILLVLLSCAVCWFAWAQGGPDRLARVCSFDLLTAAAWQPELKGSIGEGSNHSNFSHQSSVKILSKFRNFRY